MSVRLAVFDCDGTLSDGQAGVVGAMTRAFQAVGHRPPDPRDIRRIVGLSLPQAVRQLMTEARETVRQQAVEAYRQEFRASRENGTLDEPLFPGMADLTRRLHEQGWTLGVATGKSDRGLASTLATNGLSAFFSTLQTADRHPSKPHPAMLQAAMAETIAEPENTVMVGDTVFDIECALAAGTDAIGVAWGYHEAHELHEAGARAVAMTPAELEKLLHDR